MAEKRQSDRVGNYSGDSLLVIGTFKGKAKYQQLSDV